MAENGISTLTTKEERQIAKLNLAQTKRQLTGSQGRVLKYYDLDLLPTKYSGNTVVNNPNVGGLVAGRPWKTTPNIISGLWRTHYNAYWNADPTFFDNNSPASEGEVADFSVDDVMDTDISVQWLGYFRAPTTASYTFYAESDDFCGVWIGDLAVTAYTQENADLFGDYGLVSDPIGLDAGQYYPIRVMYGNNGGPGSFSFSWSASIEQTGLVVLLNAASGWDGLGNWTNDPALSQAGFDASSLNYPAIDTTGGITSMLFDGLTNYWDITNPTSGDFSVGVWFNTTSTVGGGSNFFNNPNLVGSDSAGPAADWGLCMRGGQIGFGGVSGQTAFTTQTFNDGAWHYVVATRVQTTGAMTIFVDGVQLAQITEAPGAILSDTPYIRVAGDPTNTAFWQGLIAEVHFNQIALSPAQVLSNFTIERGAYGV